MLVAEGHSNEEIAKTLFVNQETVKSHIRQMLRRLQARNRQHAVALGFRLGLLSTTSPENTSSLSDLYLSTSASESRRSQAARSKRATRD